MNSGIRRLEQMIKLFDLLISHSRINKFKKIIELCEINKIEFSEIILHIYIFVRINNFSNIFSAAFSLSDSFYSFKFIKDFIFIHDFHKNYQVIIFQT